ncbi:phage conserved hypothetical protein, phiE125 gp8 family [Faunimonas pinastri]|uniref:PhiE125 gp8 family phage protein n=1 Tax=Faunimonas pinastri TaxID=1855383 RepID=A0A1H9M960_9HYPH|nr:head-tail connector protein [Faunimonas pinastri]SER20005.1 phage conserved hypothetical protein, phiE125 gp8 family [Faunimonas pinastri]
MKRMLLSGPVTEPLLVPEMNAHLRLDGHDEDDLVGALIAAARVAVETEIRRVLISQRWRIAFEHWPRHGILLPVPPLLSVDAVRQIGFDGTTTAFDPASFEVDESAGIVLPGDIALNGRGFEIDYTAGYGRSGLDVPQPLRQAMRMLVTHWYEHRSATILGDSVASTPEGYRPLVAPYRRMALC